MISDERKLMYSERNDCYCEISFPMEFENLAIAGWINVTGQPEHEKLFKLYTTAKEPLP